jgi:hypothetical protein
VIADDEDDSMAANPEPPRIEAGYGDVRGPRRRERPGEHGRWVIRFVPEDPRRPEPPPAAKVCEICKAEVTILHSLHPDFRRKVCGECQGRANRDRMQPSGNGGAAW